MGGCEGVDASDVCSRVFADVLQITSQSVRLINEETQELIW